MTDLLCVSATEINLSSWPKVRKYKFNILAWTDIQQHVCWSHSIWDSFKTYGAFSWMRRTELTVENKSKQPSLLMTQYTSGRRGPFPVGCTKAADKHGETRLQMLSQGQTERIFCPVHITFHRNKCACRLQETGVVGGWGKWGSGGQKSSLISANGSFISQFLS